MIVTDAKFNSVRSGRHSQNDVKHHIALRRLHLDFMGLHVRTNGMFLRIGDIGDYFQYLVGLPSYNTCCGCGFNSFQTAGVWYNNTLHILDDVAAGFYQNRFRFSAQHLPRLGGTVSEGNRLRTPNGRN